MRRVRVALSQVGGRSGGECRLEPARAGSSARRRGRRSAALADDGTVARARLLDPGADAAVAGASCALPARPSRPAAVLLGQRTWHHLGHRVVGGALAVPVEDRPGRRGARRRSGARRATTAASRSSGWCISSRSIRPARRVCHFSWSAPSRSSSSAKVSRTRRRGPWAERRRGARRPRRSRSRRTSPRRWKDVQVMVLLLVSAVSGLGGGRHSHTVSTYPEYAHIPSVCQR